MSRPISNVPLELSEVMVGHVRLVARPGMRFPVTQADGQLAVNVPELGLHVIARDRKVAHRVGRARGRKGLAGCSARLCR